MIINGKPFIHIVILKQMNKKEIKEKLQDYYGTAMLNGFPAAMADLNELEDMDDEQFDDDQEI